MPTTTTEFSKNGEILFLAHHRPITLVVYYPTQYVRAKNRIASQLSVIRQQLSMIEAYDMDGWKGARYGFIWQNGGHKSVFFRFRSRFRETPFFFLSIKHGGFSVSRFVSRCSPPSPFTTPPTKHAVARSSAPKPRSPKPGSRSSTVS